MTASLTAVFRQHSFHDGMNALSALIDEGAPSVADTIRTAADTLGIGLDPARRAQIEALGAIAQTDHTGAYHNERHFREVVACTAFLLSQIGDRLNDDQKYLLLVAAAAHDIGHDGTSNKLADGHRPYRLEDLSFAAVAPLLRARGMNEGDLRDLKALLRATDISKAAPDQPSPAQAVREEIALAGLETFRDNADLRLMATVLQAADIMPSAAISERCSRDMSDYLETESGLPATPQNFAWFADNIARGALSSVPDVGAQLEQRMDGIKAAILKP